MKRLLLLIALLWGIQAPCAASPAGSPMRQAVQEALQAIDDAERTAVRTQSLEALNTAACEQVIRELGLKGKQREQFSALYTAYRNELARALNTDANGSGLDQSGQCAALKARLDNIASTARIKRDYVDKFAAVLSAEQIRLLYNTEGAIGTRIKRSAATRRRSGNNLRGSGNPVTQSVGVVGDYTGLCVSGGIEVVVSPTAQQVVLTADDNVIDYVTFDNRGGVLTFGFQPEARSVSDVRITAVVPASLSLNRMSAKSYGKIECRLPLKASVLTIETSGGGSIRADIEADRLELDASGYGKFRGTITAARCTARIGGGATAEGAIRCTGECTLRLQSYGQFKGAARAAVLTLDAGGGATWTGAVRAEELNLTVTSYGKILGPIEGGTATLTASSGANINGTFTGEGFTATANSYGKINLKGGAVVPSGAVTVQSGGSFLAPDLKVDRLTVTATSYGKAEVRCTGRLSTDISSGGKIGYAGECTVEAKSPGLIKRR